MSPFKIQRSNDVHQFLDDISDCWFVFFLSHRKQNRSQANSFFLCWLYDLDWIDANGVPKTFAFFWYLETPNRSSLYFFVEICCRLFTDKCHQSIEMRPFQFETIQISRWTDRMQITLFYSIQNVFYSQLNNFITFFSHFFLNLKFHSLIVIQLCIELLI